MLLDSLVMCSHPRMSHNLHSSLPYIWSTMSTGTPSPRTRKRSHGSSARLSFLGIPDYQKQKFVTSAAGSIIPAIWLSRLTDFYHRRRTPAATTNSP